MNIFIENVPNGATEREIRQLLSNYGKVQSVRLTPGSQDSKYLGTGLIELEDIHIKDVGVLPDRCLFKGTVIYIRCEQSATNSHSTDNSVALSNPCAPAPRQPDNCAKYMLRIISVEKVLDPDTGKSNGWCRYSIESPAGSITGLRRGSLTEVKRYAEGATEAFNLRNMLGRRRSPTWLSRQKK